MHRFSALLQNLCFLYTVRLFIEHYARVARLGTIRFLFPKSQQLHPVLCRIAYPCQARPGHNEYLPVCPGIIADNPYFPLPGILLQ